MTRSYRSAQRITQPLVSFEARAPRHPAITSSEFTCYRLVSAGESLVAIELHYTTTRMAAVVTR
jgi:hypothetical protein